MSLYGLMAKQATIALLLVISWSYPVYAGSMSESLQELSETLNSREQFNRCYEREKDAGTFNYSRCAEDSGRRRQDFEAEQDRRRSDLRRKQDSEQQELDELLKMPNVSDEMHARFGQVITFDECMSVYDERNMYGKRGFTRSDARSSCTTFANNVRAYCLKSRDEQCAEKGFLRPDQTAGALQQQQFEAQQRQQDAMERRQEQEQQRRKAMREQWIKQGGTPGVCPGLQALLDKNHPCQY